MGKLQIAIQALDPTDPACPVLEDALKKEGQATLRLEEQSSPQSNLWFVRRRDWTRQRRNHREAMVSEQSWFETGCHRGFSLESAAARVCREAGARVSLNVRVHDLDLLPLGRPDNRRIEIIGDAIVPQGAGGSGHHHGVSIAS